MFSASAHKRLTKRAHKCSADMAYIPLVSVNLATVALESVFYGIFAVLASTSIFFHITHAKNSQTSQRRNYAVLLEPVFIGSILITLAVTGVCATSSMFNAMAQTDTVRPIALGHNGYTTL